MPKTFLICPVRNVSPDKTMGYVRGLEKAGWSVHWPHRDTDQSDMIGLKICQTNLQAIMDSDCVHVVWDGESQGCLFDLGMAFALSKKIISISIPEETNHKSFQNVIQALQSKFQNDL